MRTERGSGRNWSAAALLLLIFGLGAATLLSPRSEFSETENRVLAQAPAFSLEAALRGEFEADYEEYLADQFVLRDRWIELKTSVERLLLRRESKDVYFAADGYLIEKHTGAYETQRARENIAALEESVRQNAATLGLEHISVVLVPNAVDVLRGKLPPFAAPGGGDGYLKRAADALPPEVWLDAAAVLRAHDGEELYYRTDHHWKTLAAFYVYQAWARQQGFRVPAMDEYDVETVTDCFEGTIQSKLGIRTPGDSIELFLPKEAPAYTVQWARPARVAHSVYDASALETKDKYAVYFGGNDSLIRIQTEVENGRSILVVKDSYANCFVPFMIGEFQEIDLLDFRYAHQGLSAQLQAGEYTDLLFLYNASGFAEDANIARRIRQEVST